jgi:hypothetical protein
VNPYRKWSESDDQRLRMLWSEVAVGRLHERFEGRTPCAVYCRAVRIGLTRAAPQGTAYVGALAREYGFCPATFKRILRWAGVHSRPGQALPGTEGKNYRWKIVDRGQAERAVDEWLSTENVRGAAMSRGLCPKRLNYIVVRAERAGLVPEHKAGKRKQRRLKSEVFDQLIEDYERHLREDHARLRRERFVEMGKSRAGVVARQQKRQQAESGCA